jgi:hypothetical protein
MRGYNPAMRRLPRILLNAATGVSLVICVVTLVLWVRSRHITERFGGSGNRSFVVAGGGEFAIYLRRHPDGFFLPDEWHRYQFSRNSPAGDFLKGVIERGRLWRALGITASFEEIGSPPAVTIVCAVIPYSIPISLAAALPVARTAARLMRRRPPTGLCPACGYDLRATPDRCPECGTVPSAR